MTAKNHKRVPGMITLIQVGNIELSYLHCTSREALVFTVVSNPLSAEHQYFPDFSLLALKLKVSPMPTVLPSLSHVMSGVGLPVAVQWNVTSSFSIIV